ncbi:hypothetical protein [Kitasatospora sp. NPDC127116]|uniref:hypothetical protein n=1 Tax=unclassified Kitasatospora TaxID=2633591 RepID=UPI0033787924
MYAQPKKAGPLNDNRSQQPPAHRTGREVSRRGGLLAFSRETGKGAAFTRYSAESRTDRTCFYRAMTEAEFRHLERTDRMPVQEKGYQGLSPTREYAEKYLGKPGYLVEFAIDPSVSLEADLFSYTGVLAKPQDGVMSFGLAKTATLAAWVKAKPKKGAEGFARPGDAVQYFNQWLAVKLVTWRVVACNV